MRRRTIHVDLPEACNLVSRFPGGQETERGIALDLSFECKLCPGKETHGNARLTGICEAARDGIGELCRNQFVTDLRWPGRYIVKTVVTHRTPPVCAQPRRRPSALWIAAKQHDLLMSTATAILPKSNAALPCATARGYLCSEPPITNERRKSDEQRNANLHAGCATGTGRARVVEGIRAAHS